MRALAAAALVLGLLVASAIPHVHVVAHGGEECAMCVVRGGDVACTETPDPVPLVVEAEAVAPEPAPAPATGAPLGAIPGQSPPAAA